MSKPPIKRSVDPLKDERYTLAATIEECERLAGVERFTLDVAACDLSHWASLYYTKAEDGLTSPWHGDVWCNPPYSVIRPWVEKAWAAVVHERTARSVSMLLPATRTEQPWWQDLVEPYRDRPGSVLRVHFLRGRVPFGNPEHPTGDPEKPSPPFTVCLLVWRLP